MSPSGMASASQADSGEFDSRHLLQKRRLPCEGVLFWRKTTTDESRGWSCERERAFCPIGIFFRNTPRQNKQHSVLFGGARRQRRDSRHLLQKRRLPHGGVLFWRKTTISLLGSLVQRELAAIWQTEGLAVSVSELLIPSVTPRHLPFVKKGRHENGALHLPLP